MNKELYLLPIALLLSSCGNTTNNESSIPSEIESISVEEEQTEFSIHTENQNAYLLDNYIYTSQYAKGTKEDSRPLPVSLSWDLESSNGYKVLLSEDESFSSYVTYETTDNSLDIYNLKINTRYYYKVTSFDELVSTNIKEFDIIDKKIRNLYVDGLTNVRDIGGYETSDGKHVKQGMIIRSSKLNEDKSDTQLITQKGIDTMLNDLHIKTELDLRKTSDNENGGLEASLLGDSVNYISSPMQSGGNYLLLNKAVLKDVLAIFADENNYPIDVHCSIGTDRTGIICFLINALLGVSEEDLYFDYLFSNFGNIGGSRLYTVIQKYIKEFDYTAGDTLSEKVYNYLVAQEVPTETLDSIIEIMKA